MFFQYKKESKAKTKAKTLSVIEVVQRKLSRRKTNLPS